ncbi:MAG: selenide, water dikinase SelD [Pseudomonadota bacterium]
MIDLVLVGGGHSHALFLKMWAMKPLSQVRLTLVSPEPLTPYSGMIPGYLAGVYSYEDVHIDLFRLTAFAEVRFLVDSVESLDLVRKQVNLNATGKLEFDILSLNIGSTPYSLPDFSQRLTPIKPIQHFLQVFDQIVMRTEIQSLAVVGAGASGVELALNLSVRLPQARVTLIHASSKILESFPDSVRDILLKELALRSIELKLNTTVLSEKNGTLFASGMEREFDHIFWTTSPKAPDWIKDSGLSVDRRGFVEILPSMQSSSHSYVFAAGDVSSLKNYNLAKSGVYAVRSARFLLANIKAYIQNRPQKQWKPNLTPLALIGINGKSAVAAKGSFGFRANFLWQIKDRIDRRFMAQFQNLRPMEEDMPCGGCAAKVSPTALGCFLSTDPGTGISKEDASLLPFENLDLIASIDRLTSLVLDPFVFGQIAVLHSLSDIYAAGGTPRYMQVSVELPRSTQDLHHRDIGRIMDGVMASAKSSGVELKGGHSGVGEELAVTVAVIGNTGQKSTQKRSGTEGDVLVLTKPLGTGIVFSGLMQQKTEAKSVQQTIHSMLQSNRKIAEIFSDLGVEAQTDVSGFGLLGHLLEMLQGNVSAVINESKLPSFTGVPSLISKGIRSSAYAQNSIFLKYLHASKWPEALKYLLCDPQTSGGLLACVPQSLLPELWHQVDRLGLERPWAIGHIVSLRAKPIYLEP